MKRTLFFLLLSISITACVTAPQPQATTVQTPIPTVINTSTSPPPTLTPRPTATSEPTATPTETVPMIQVGELSVPDPRVDHLARKYFYTKEAVVNGMKYSSPTLELVNAMKMAGFEVTAEQVSGEIKFQELKDKSGNPFVVGIYNLDPDPSQQSETLEKPVPLIIFTNNNKSDEMEWKEASPSILGEKHGLLFGSVSGPPGTGETTYLSHNSKTNRFDTTITITDVWRNREKIEGLTNWNYINSEIDEAFDLGADSIIINHLVFPGSTPDWLSSKSPQDLELSILEHIEDHMRYIFEKISQKSIQYENTKLELKFNVTNEVWHNSTLSKKLGGRDRLVLMSVQKAIEVREEILQENRNIRPKITIELGISNADSHYQGGEGARQLFELLKMLEENGIHLDYVDLHGHEKNCLNLPDPIWIEKAITNFGRSFTQLNGEPIEVKIGEYDLNISKCKDDPKRYFKQAERYYDVLRTVLGTGVTEFTLWGIVDSESWFEDKDSSEPQYYSVNADALVFDDSGNPKMSYFAMLAAILDFYHTQ